MCTSKASQTDKVIEFVPHDSELIGSIDKQHWVQKEVERPKFRAKDVIEIMRSEGFQRFNQHHHTVLWQSQDAKNPGRGYGVEVQGLWYWYDRWVDVARKHCRENRDRYVAATG